MTKSSWSKTAVYYAAFITIGLTNAVLGPTLPNLAANTRTALSEIGFLFTARSLGFMIGSLLGARLYDRLHGQRLMAAAIVAMSLTLALTPTINRIGALTAVLFLMGFAENMVDVGGNTLLVWTHGEKVGPYMNGLHFFFGVGAFLSPIVVAQVLRYSDGLSWAYWLLALIILPVSILLGVSPGVTAVHQPTAPAATQANRRLIGLIMAFFFLYVGLEVGFGGWIFTYAISTAIMSESSAAYLTSAFWGALTVGRLLAIPLAARLRPRMILFMDLAGALLSVGVMIVWAETAVALWLGIIGLGLSFASIFPTALTLAGRRMTITGQLTGWLFIGASLGGMTLPWLMGYLLETIAPQSIHWFGLGGLFLALGLIILISRQGQACVTPGRI